MTTPCRWASSGSGNRNVPRSSGVTSGRVVISRYDSRGTGSPQPVISTSGGEGGIRTRDGFPRTAFPVRRHSPLGDLSERQTIVGGSVVVGATSARRDGRPWQGGAEHRSERTKSA